LIKSESHTTLIKGMGLNRMHKFSFYCLAFLPWFLAIHSSSADDLHQAVDLANKCMDQVNSKPQECPDQTTYSASLPGCSELVEKFCDKLYSPPQNGNLDLKTGPNEVTPIRLGENNKGFEMDYVHFEEAKLAAEDRLSKDFQEKLKARNYFVKLRQFLQTKPLEQMSLSERAQTDRLGDEVSSIWNESFNETVLERMEKLHPGYSRMKIIPPTLQKENTLENNKLSASNFQALWKENPSWKKVESDFQLAQSTYVDWLEKHTALDTETKKDWIARIQSVTLRILGSDLDGSDPDISDEECATTNHNAYYDPQRNTVTVCAGDFTSSRMLTILTHELSHSLDVRRSIEIFKENSEYGKLLRGLENSVCQGLQKSPDFCEKEWAPFKSKNKHYLKSLEHFAVTKPNYFSCLQYHSSLTTPSKKTFNNMAKSRANSEVSAIAETKDESFLILTRTKLTMSDGSKQENPAYFNPCGLPSWQQVPLYYPTSFEVQTFFVAEYACDHTSKTPEDRMENAIQTAQTHYESLLKKTIPLGGKFSYDSDLAAEGYAEDSGERFADSMGYQVFSEILKKTPDLEMRRQLYYSAVAKRCEKPSISKEYPSEAQVEKRHSLEPHSEGKQRRLENLIAPIRAALNCKKDFKLKECTL
jgi:hypothetical protein